MKRQAIKPQTIRDAAGLVGAVSILSGLIGFDWRLAAIVGGSALLIGAVYGTLKR